MSHYLDQLCDALTTVLDRCAQLDRRRLAGYAANIDFWIEEAQHRLRLIDGLTDRRQRMIAVTQAVYAEDIRRAAPVTVRDKDLADVNTTDVSADWNALQQQAQALRDRVLKSTQRFVRKCVDTELIVAEKLFEIEERLGVNLRGR